MPVSNGGDVHDLVLVVERTVCGYRQPIRGYLPGNHVPNSSKSIDLQFKVYRFVPLIGESCMKQILNSPANKDQGGFALAGRTERVQRPGVTYDQFHTDMSPGGYWLHTSVAFATTPLLLKKIFM